MRTFLPFLAVVGLLAGCAPGVAGGPPPLTPLSRYALQVEPGLDRIALAVHDAGLSENQAAALHAFAHRYRTSGAGWVEVQGPWGEDEAAIRQTWAVRAALEAAGVPADQLRLSSYNAPDPRAPVLASFETVQAAVPNCAAEPRSMEGRFSNQSSPGLGCAVTANMAAQIADPRDILGARPISPADSGRAAVVFQNYRAGQQSSATQEPLVQGQIAQAVE